VAVTVNRQAPFVVLDDEDRIVEVGSAAESQFAPLVGAVVWECFPGSEPLFKPYYDAARRTGEPVELVQFFDGVVARVRAVPAGDGRLDLSWDQLLRIDTTTLDAFRLTLRKALEILEAEASDAHRDEARTALRLIEGGA
jgi:hypothetical protein